MIMPSNTILNALWFFNGKFTWNIDIIYVRILVGRFGPELSGLANHGLPNICVHACEKCKFCGWTWLHLGKDNCQYRTVCACWWARSYVMYLFCHTYGRPAIFPILCCVHKTVHTLPVRCCFLSCQSFPVLRYSSASTGTVGSWQVPCDIKCVILLQMKLINALALALQANLSKSVLLSSRQSCPCRSRQGSI